MDASPGLESPVSYYLTRGGTREEKAEQIKYYLFNKVCPGKTSRRTLHYFRQPLCQSSFPSTATILRKPLAFDHQYI